MNTNNVAVQTENISALYHFSLGPTISERNGSDFDLESFRGSILGRTEKKVKNLKRSKLDTFKAASNIAVDEQQDPRDITFQRSDNLSVQGSISNSPLPRNGPPREDPSPNVSQEEIAAAPHPRTTDSPASVHRLKSKTVSFRLGEVRQDARPEDLDPKDCSIRDFESSSNHLKAPE